MGTDLGRRVRIEEKTFTSGAPERRLLFFTRGPTRWYPKAPWVHVCGVDPPRPQGHQTVASLPLLNYWWWWTRFVNYAIYLGDYCIILLFMLTQETISQLPNEPPSEGNELTATVQMYSLSLLPVASFLIIVPNKATKINSCQQSIVVS